MLVDAVGVCVGIDPFDKLVECLKIQSQIQIMDKCLFLVSDVDKGSVKGRKNFLYFSEIDISH